MATNDTFYGKTKIFVIKSLEVLEEIKDREGIPLSPPEEEIAISKNSTSSRFVQKPDFPHFIFNNWKKIKELPEYEECKKCMYENKTINKHLGKLVGTVESAIRIDVDTCLQRLILKLILDSGSLKFNEKIFTEYFEKFRKFFANDKLQFRAFAPLECFTADVNEIQLDDNLRVFKIPSHKLEELLKNSTDMPIPHFRMLSLVLSHGFGIERIYETDKIIGERTERHSNRPTQETMRIFDEVISALRLFKPGTVGYNFIQTKAVDWRPIGDGGISSGIFTYPYFGAYPLKEDEIVDFKDFFKKLKNKPKFLDIPHRYFNYAHTRERPEDKLIDYMIAFEGLFKVDVELKFRLSLMVAAFLGGNQKEKGSVFNLMRKAYNLRSKIVHGSSYSKNIEINEEKLSFGELVSLVEELLRKSIEKSIETGQKPDQILENCPESIFV
ncbi:MAG TPA: hypothetical protein C5S37_02200 [Methanophagales archaeon]|nr:hypothetical protein [Methanophagales archaeon]